MEKEVNDVCCFCVAENMRIKWMWADLITNMFEMLHIRVNLSNHTQNIRTFVSSILLHKI